MSIPELNILVHDYLQLDSEIKQKTIEANNIKEKLKSELEARNVEELAVGEHIVRYRNVVSSTFNLSAFKDQFENLYTLFIKQIPSKKFSIS